MLGLKHGVNLLVNYDPEWPAAFEEERTLIRSAVGDAAHGIEHYGSTAVVGLRAKPIIDILLGVAPLANWIKCKAPLEILGYDYAENAGVPGHFIFGRGRDRSERTHLVHVVEFDGAPWRSNLAFRDALRADESLRASYLSMKEQAVGFGSGRTCEIQCVEADVHRTLQRANQSVVYLVARSGNDDTLSTCGSSGIEAPKRPLGEPFRRGYRNNQSSTLCSMRNTPRKLRAVGTYLRVARVT
jgi:GrpB-like predicted nucleotidyltransferase (UPF0157 family)